MCGINTELTPPALLNFDKTVKS